MVVDRDRDAARLDRGLDGREQLGLRRDDEQGKARDLGVLEEGCDLLLAVDAVVAAADDLQARVLELLPSGGQLVGRQIVGQVGVGLDVDVGHAASLHGFDGLRPLEVAERVGSDAEADLFFGGPGREPGSRRPNRRGLEDVASRQHRYSPE